MQLFCFYNEHIICSQPENEISKSDAPRSLNGVQRIWYMQYSATSNSCVHIPISHTRQARWYMYYVYYTKVIASKASKVLRWGYRLITFPFTQCITHHDFVNNYLNPIFLSLLSYVSTIHLTPSHVRTFEGAHHRITTRWRSRVS